MTTSGRLGIVTTVAVRVTVTAVLGNKQENAYVIMETGLSR